VFLLAIHSNYVPIMHHFWDIARYWSKITIWTYPTSIWQPCWGDPIGISSSFWHQKTRESLGYSIWRCLRDPMFSRFWYSASFWQTDGQVDRHTMIAYTALA